MTDTKPDLSREAVERLANGLDEYVASLGIPGQKSQEAVVLIALLDAKEAAERDKDEWKGRAEHWHQAYTEARASVAAAWEAGRDHVIYVVCRAGVDASGFTCLTNPDHSATEALRRVKEAVWDQCNDAHVYAGGFLVPNPYAAKEAAR